MFVRVMMRVLGSRRQRVMHIGRCDQGLRRNHQHQQNWQPFFHGHGHQKNRLDDVLRLKSLIKRSSRYNDLPILSVFVSMMDVRKMRMPVYQFLVDMFMGVRFFAIPGKIMRMLVMNVMMVHMGMPHRIMDV